MKFKELLKQKYVIVSSIVVAVTTLLTFGTNIIDFTERILKLGSRPTLIQFALSESSYGYQHIKTGKFGVSKNIYETFEQVHPLNSSPSLVLLFIIQNPTSKELFVESISYNVHEKGEVKSLAPAPLIPNKKYVHNIMWVEGKQNSSLIPVYSVPSNMTGSFEVEIITPESTPMGAGIILTIDINTNLGILTTDTIQIFLPVSSKSNSGNLRTENSGTFEQINNATLPGFSDVDLIFETSKLKAICTKLKIDQMERDLMFLKVATTPFDQYKKLEFEDGSHKKYIDIFPENDLKYFWLSARDFLKDKQ